VRKIFQDIWLKWVQGSSPAVFSLLLKIGLRFLSFLYYFLVQLRLFLYSHDLLKKERIRVPVISIGNITLGGVGKTPFVQYLARNLLRKGFEPAILSRGYGGKSEHSFLIVSDGKQIFSTSEKAGDEPFLLARSLSGVPVLVGKDRVKTGRYAVEAFRVKFLLLDDGFQYLKLHRDLDILLIDTTNPFGSGWLLPAGILREPVRNLSRAHLFVLTKIEGEKEVQELERLLFSINPRAKILKAVHRPQKLWELGRRKERPIIYLEGRKILALSSIGNPNSFEKTLHQLEVELKESIRFPDHHRYLKRELKEVEEKALKIGAEMVVTTEKDEARLPKDFSFSFPWMVLSISLEIIEGERELEEELKKLSLLVLS